MGYLIDLNRLNIFMHITASVALSNSFISRYYLTKSSSVGCESDGAGEEVVNVTISQV